MSPYVNVQAARELEGERRRAEALAAEQAAARQQLAALRAEVGALKQQRGQRADQQLAAAEVRGYISSAVWHRALALLATDLLHPKHEVLGPISPCYEQLKSIEGRHTMLCRRGPRRPRRRLRLQRLLQSRSVSICRGRQMSPGRLLASGRRPTRSLTASMTTCR